MSIDKDQARGQVNQAEGKIKEFVGKIVTDEHLEATDEVQAMMGEVATCRRSQVMRIRSSIDSQRAKASEALPEDRANEANTVAPRTLGTKIARSTRSKYLGFRETKPGASLAEQDPYYMARATALHACCHGCTGTDVKNP